MKNDQQEGETLTLGIIKLKERNTFIVCMTINNGSLIVCPQTMDHVKCTPLNECHSVTDHDYIYFLNEKWDLSK